MKMLWMSWLKWLMLASLTLQGTNWIPLHSTITLWKPVTSFGTQQCFTKVLVHYDLYFYLCYPWTSAVGFLGFLSSISLSWSNTYPLDFTEATASYWKPPCFYSCLHKDAQDDVQGWVWVMVFPEMKQIWPFSNTPPFPNYLEMKWKQELHIFHHNVFLGLLVINQTPWGAQAVGSEGQVCTKHPRRRHRGEDVTAVPKCCAHGSWYQELALIVLINILLSLPLSLEPTHG